MKISHHSLKVIWLLLTGIAALAVVGCKPDSPRQTGAFVSPALTPTATAPAPVSPLQTPRPTPWPENFTPEPPPSPTFAVLIGPQSLYDPVRHFSLTLPPGWYAIAGDIANYDISHIEHRPANGLIAQINGSSLPSGQTFEQWLANYRVQETSPDNGAFGVTLTPPQPYKLGRYDAVAYTATGQGESVFVLIVPSGDGWVAVISLSPYDASNPPPPSLTEALSMLSTIQISAQPLQSWDIITPLAPTPTPCMVVGPQTLYDPTNHFSVTLLSGWYATPPDPKAIGGATDIVNYDLCHIEHRPPNGLEVQISGSSLPADQSFEQWLSNDRFQATSPTNGAFGVTLTAPEPYKLGKYTGVSYVATSQAGESALVIVIQPVDGWVLGIGVSPYDKVSSPPLPAFSDALAMLNTITISPTIAVK